VTGKNPPKKRRPRTAGPAPRQISSARPPERRQRPADDEPIGLLLPEPPEYLPWHRRTGISSLDDYELPEPAFGDGRPRPWRWRVDRRTYAIENSYGEVFRIRYRWYERVDYWLAFVLLAAVVVTVVLLLTTG
jgi:hypothetical protein